MQLAVGKAETVTGLPFPNQGGLIGPRASEMAIEAIETQVGGAPCKPLGERRITPIEHRVERLKPVQLTTGQVAPEGIGITFSLAA